MYPRYKVEKLVKCYAPRLIEELGLSKMTIKIHVYKSNSKKLKAMDIPRAECDGLCGITYRQTDRAEIVLFYDKLKGRKDSLGVLYHELLHCRFQPLMELITLKETKATKIEEILVRDLESMFVARLK